MPKEKSREEIDQDLQDQISSNDSWQARIELILLQILRELKKNNPSR